MQKFYFESVNTSGEKVSGHVFGENEQDARKKLKKNNLVIVTLTLYDETAHLDKALKFEFEATNTEGKTFHGEIEAENAYSAYKKLRKDYHFTVHYIVDLRAPKTEKDKWKSLGVSEEFKKRFTEEQERLTKKPTKDSLHRSELKQKNDTPIKRILEEKKERMAFLQKQIDETIEKVSTLVNKYDRFLQPEKRRHIQGELDRLARLRRSNSVEHLEKIIVELFDLLASDEIFLDLQGELVDELEATKKEFRTVSMSFKHTLHKGLASITIDVESIKEGLDLLLNQKKFLPRLFRALGSFFMGLTLMSFFFLIFHGGRSLFGIESLESTLFIRSQFFWMIFVFSLLCMVFFIGQRTLLLTLHWKKNLTYSGLFFLVLVFLFIEFPVLFWWVQF